MAEGPRMTAAQLADKLLASEHADVLRESVAWMVAELMEAEVAAKVGAELGERTPERVAQRNGYRARAWDTRVGELELAIPRLRTGSYFPSFLEPRRRAEQALVAVVQEAYVNGISTRKVDRLVEQLGLQQMTKDTVSRLCRGLDEQVQVFRERPLAGAYPYLWLDAKVERVREPGGVRHKALVIAYGVHETGRREVVGIDVGEAESESFWRSFLRSLRARGLDGVQLVISDAHTGLKQAIAAVMAGAAWQRCRVHFLRNVLTRVPKGSAEMVAAAIRTIFAQPTGAEVVDQVDKVAAMLAGKFPAVAAMLADAREDLTAFASFPTPHWVKIWSTNPLERLNKEVKRRTNVVGIFPDDAAVLRLAGAVLIEAHDEWQVAERRYLSEGSMAKLATTRDDAARPKEVRRATAELVAT